MIIFARPGALIIQLHLPQLNQCAHMLCKGFVRSDMIQVPNTGSAYLARQGLVVDQGSDVGEMAGFAVELLDEMAKGLGLQLISLVRRSVELVAGWVWLRCCG